MLSSTEDSSLYSRTVRGDGSILGTYFVNGSKADCEAVFSTVRFEDATGELDPDPASGTSSTLQEAVAGRTVGTPSISYDKSDGVYRFEVTVLWRAALTDALPAFGNYISNTSVVEYVSVESLPADGALDPAYSADGTTRTDYDLRGPSGSGLPERNEDGTYSYSIVATTVTVTKKAGVTGATDGDRLSSGRVWKAHHPQSSRKEHQLPANPAADCRGFGLPNRSSHWRVCRDSLGQ